MPPYLILIILSILGVVVIAQLCPDNAAWRSIVYSLGFGHYLLALMYSKKQIGQVLSQSHSVNPLLIILVLGAGLYLTDFPLIHYFAVHHVCNEMYLPGRGIAQGEDPREKYRRISAMTMNFFSYYVILRNAPAIRFIDPATLLAGLAVSSVAFFSILYHMRASLTVQKGMDRCGIELIGLLMVAVSFVVPIHFLHVVCYHFVFWGLFPALKLARSGSRTILQYVLMTCIATGGFIALSPIGVHKYPMAWSLFAGQFILWSYVHITSSFAVSNLHPMWITSRFKPRVLQHTAR